MRETFLIRLLTDKEKNLLQPMLEDKENEYRGKIILLKDEEDNLYSDSILLYEDEKG